MEQEPEVPVADVPQAPLNRLKVGLYMLFGALALGFVFMMALGLRGPTPDQQAARMASQQQQVRPTDKGQVESFGAANKQDTQDVIDALAKKLANDAAGQDKAANQGAPHPKDPDIADLAHRHDANLSDGMGISDNQSPAQIKAAAKAKALEDAMNSSAVALDITKNTAKTDQSADHDQHHDREDDPLSINEQLKQIEKIELAHEEPPYGHSKADEADADRLISHTYDEEREQMIDPDKAKENLGPQARKTGTQAYPFDTHSGRTYKVFEGTILETLLDNRLEGEFTGPVMTHLVTDVYSNNHQVLLIPSGTRLLGEAAKVGSTGQQRLSVTFHRMIMYDGYSVDLDQFKGLNQQGAAGLDGKVNNHYLKIFGASIAIGAIGGLAQIGNSGVGIGFGDPSVAIRNGMSSQFGQESTQILDRFLNLMPTITVKEGHRVRVWIAQDFDLPAYADHTVDPAL